MVICLAFFFSPCTVDQLVLFCFPGSEIRLAYRSDDARQNRGTADRVRHSPRGHSLHASHQVPVPIMLILVKILRHA